MILSAEEFILLRTSDNSKDQWRAGTEEADITVWLIVINDYPEYKKWVVYNKTVPMEILEILMTDPDPKVRGVIARKRKINDKIFEVLSKDPDENVRYDLICNTKLPIEKLKKIDVSDSDWLKEQLREKIASKL